MRTHIVKASDDMFVNFGMVAWWSIALGVVTFRYVSGQTEALPAECTPNLTVFIDQADADWSTGIVKLSDSEGVNLECLTRIERGSLLGIENVTVFVPAQLLGFKTYTGSKRDRLYEVLGWGD